MKPPARYPFNTETYLHLEHVLLPWLTGRHSLMIESKGPLKALYITLRGSLPTLSSWGRSRPCHTHTLSKHIILVTGPTKKKIHRILQGPSCWGHSSPQHSIGLVHLPTINTLKLPSFFSNKLHTEHIIIHKPDFEGIFLVGWGSSSQKR